MKRWRRSGGVGGVTLAVLLQDIGGGLYSAEPNAAFTALAAATVDIFEIWNGGAPVLLEQQPWPYFSAIHDSTGHAGETLVSRWTLNTGVSVDSNLVAIP